MATKVQSKTYFPGSMMDLNNGFCNGMWDPYHDDRASASEKSQCYNSFMMMQAMDGYSGYAKEQMRQTILKQESIFRHQLGELHRVYRRQRDLMNELTMKEQCNFSMPLKDYGPLNLKSSTSQRRVIDLELPADVYEDNEGKQPVGNVHKLADLNEPIHMEEAPFAPANPNSGLWYLRKTSQQKEMEAAMHKKELLSYNNGYGNGILQGDPRKPVENLSKKRTIFGVELCERSHTPIDSSQNLEKKLPPWLMVKPNLCNEQTKGKETTIYQMSMDSLQHHSHQFFKKSEITKVQADNNHQGITKILGVPIVNSSHDQNAIKENGKINLRNHIDLNLSFDEEEAPLSTPCIPESVVKIATMEIDLEAPATLESETDTPSDDVFMDGDEDLVKVAAEAIMSISSFDPLPEEAPQAEADTLLRWFAEVISGGDKKDSETVNSGEEFIIPEGMDYFEYMTLKIQETKEEPYCYTPIEEDEGLLRKRPIRKGQGKRGRQRKDFQRDVLPGIVSLSRREVTEDIQTFEEAFVGIGVSWQSKRKVSGKNARGRRRLVASDPSSHTPLPPPPSPPPVVVEQSVCREEKGLSGWGKRTRRLPRQRCQNGGNHQSLALKC